MRRKTRTDLSLWSFIDGLQRRLEALGLERDMVDAAVEQQIAAILERSDRPARSFGGLVWANAAGEA